MISREEFSIKNKVFDTNVEHPADMILPPAPTRNHVGCDKSPKGANIDDKAAAEKARAAS